MINLLLVGIGGFLGSISRYGLYLYFERALSTEYPWATLLVNTVGSFILGLIIALAGAEGISERQRLLFAVGFCGSFTTFSTFAVDNLQLIQTGQSISSLLNIGLHIIGTLLLAGLGFWLGQKLKGL